jgi:hypothetical protein
MDNSLNIYYQQANCTNSLEMNPGVHFQAPVVDSVVGICLCATVHGIGVSLTSIGAKSVAISRKMACFHEGSTDFELSVRGHFTDSCETRLVLR